MNYKILFCLFAMTAFLLLGTFTGCGKAEEASSLEEASSIEEEAVSLDPEQSRIALQNEMLAFFRDHQEEMERFALGLKALNESDPVYHYLYAVKENVLYAFDGVHINAQEKIMKHPLLLDAAFFKETQAFEWVSWSTIRFHCSICCFVGEVYDETGRLYVEIFIFYSEEEPVTDEYDYVEPLAENWYFYVEYRE